MVIEVGMNALTRIVLDFVLREGAVASGIATTETLEGGPPSTDLQYVLPGARSAVSFAVPLNPDLIEPHLAKRERLHITCGNCQLVCHPEKHVRKRRLDLLRSSGVVVQSEDGSLSVLSPEEASNRLHAMPPPRHPLYEDS